MNDRKQATSRICLAYSSNLQVTLKFLWKVSWLATDYIALHPRTLQLYSSLLVGYYVVLMLTCISLFSRGCLARSLNYITHLAVHVITEVFTSIASLIKTAVFWDVSPQFGRWVPRIWRKLPLSSSGQKSTFYKTTWHHIPEHCNLDSLHTSLLRVNYGAFHLHHTSRPSPFYSSSYLLPVS